MGKNTIELSEEQKEEIAENKVRLGSRLSYQDLADMFGISKTNMYEKIKPKVDDISEEGDADSEEMETKTEEEPDESTEVEGNSDDTTATMILVIIIFLTFLGVYLMSI